MCILSYFELEEEEGIHLLSSLLLFFTFISRSRLFIIFAIRIKSNRKREGKKNSSFSFPLLYIF